jgi:DNA polymerase-3 subunit alpha
MSKKKEDVLNAERQNFVYGNEKEGIKGCVNNGIKEEVANKIFDKMIEFAKYAFNKSHAAAYSVTSYMTAWVKYYYPAEFFCANLNFVGAQKEIPSIIADAQKHGIVILRPDVNKSEADFATENGNIRFGLKFLANAKTRANAVVESRESGFKNFKAFVMSKPGKAMAEACVYSGALDSYAQNNADNRNAVLAAYNELSELHDKIMRVQERIDNATKEDAKTKAEAELKTLMERWENYSTLPNVEPMGLLERLTKEQEYTSVYFSGDPLDNYEVNFKDYRTIDSLEDGETVTIAATMSDIRDLKTKKDALPMIAGKLTDKTGSIECIAFPKAYAKIADKLQTVMAWTGKVSINGEGEDAEYQLVISDAKPLPEKSKKMVVWFDDYQATKAIVQNGRVPKSEGIEVWLAGKNSKLYRAGAWITEEFAKENGLKYMIQ